MPKVLSVWVAQRCRESPFGSTGGGTFLSFVSDRKAIGGEKGLRLSSNVLQRGIGFFQIKLLRVELLAEPFHHFLIFFMGRIPNDFQ